MASAQTMAMTTTQKIIAIAVTIIIISTVALPVINDLTDEYQKNWNNTGQLFNVAEDAETVSISYVSDTVTINGYSFTPTAGDILLTCEEFFVKLHHSLGLRIYVLADGASYAITSATIENGTATFVTSGVTKTASYDSDILYISKKGTYAAFNTAFYVNDYSSIYFAHEGPVYNTGLDPTFVYLTLSAYGTYENLASTLSTANTGTVSIALNIEEYEHYAKITPQNTAVTFTNDDGTYTGSWTPIFYAPIAYENDSQFDTIGDLIGVIPILLILVPLMMAVRMIALKRN